VPSWLLTVLEVVFAGLVVAGVAVIYWPAGLILAGVAGVVACERWSPIVEQRTQRKDGGAQ
jgi:hypothetical protein